MDTSISKQTFIPVILGGNLGGYSTARSFYEAYNVSSVVVCSLVTGAIDHSVFIEPFVSKNMMKPDDFIQTLKELDKKYGDKKILLIGSSDNHVELIVQHRDQIPANWIVPYIDEQKFYYGTNKESFYEICERIGVPYPKTKVIHQLDLDLPFDYPIIIKPADSMKWHEISFPGKMKVYLCENEEQYKKIVQDVYDNHYEGSLILQEYIRGDDSAMGVVTCYSDKDQHEVKLISFGQTLLEDHTPSAIGNHLSILTREEIQVTEDVKKLLAELQWTGFSNFDLKYDERDQTYKFFELNARLGRSNYYVTAAGANTATYYVRDFIKEEPIPYQVSREEILYSAVPKRLLLANIQSTKTQQKVKELYRRKKVFHPLNSPQEPQWKRKLYVKMATMNYFKKFKQYPQNPDF
ncbi:carbamoyl phosphate synthase-like protein [Pisciglobus halotolerans]|uniref:D-aspartate ligase n=1 Tax=Pisciglobus halotolerans TaxID=745365 RepID=A0A1I3CKA3_9LACT|nr:carbamoyl phosphate synthase-like protein [Pisciglobus halotolerans]SFH74945.1 D-aspartate ligase [Pisciglobus halotolerans]